MPGTLMLHTGGRTATRDEVFAVRAPEPTSSWFPVAHGTVLSKVEELLDSAGFNITRQQLGLARNECRFFGVIDIESRITEGVSLVLGLRNSIDKSFPYGLAGGTRTFVCDNLALTGDWDELTISRKHTRNGELRFAEALSLGISKLAHYRDAEAVRIERMRQTVVTDTEAYALFMRAFERNLLSHRVIKDCLDHWKADDRWGEKSLWRLYNAMNTPLQPRAVTNPQAFSYQTMKLLALIAPEPGVIDVTPKEDFNPLD